MIATPVNRPSAGRGHPQEASAQRAEPDEDLPHGQHRQDAPARALGLSIVFAGALIAAAVLVQQVVTPEGQAGAVPGAQAIPRAAGEIPHQVAPLEGFEVGVAPVVVAIRGSTCTLRGVRDVAEIQLTRVKAHLVLEPELALIDCGYAGSRGRIARAITAHGGSIEHLARVVITHGHPDHAGSARELAEAGVPVLIHPADAEGLRTTWRDAIRRPSRGRVFSAMTPEPPEVLLIEDGDILPMLGGLQVVHTPGHTPGSVCLYGARDRVLFVGDTLQRRFGRVSYASALYSDDYAAARRAVKRLADLDVETIVFGHFAPMSENAADALADLARRAT